jgi:hypothetical protein
MLRLLRRLLTALSLLTLIATLSLWARACWMQDIVKHKGMRSEGRTLFLTYTTVQTCTDALYVTRNDGSCELTEGPAADTFGQQHAAHVGWNHSTLGADSLSEDLPEGSFWGFYWKLDPPALETRAAAADPTFDPGWNTARSRKLRLAIPWWFLAALSAVLPTLSLRRYLRKMLHHPGTCPQCGYDLRASPTRCPECGRPTDNPATSQPSHS